MGPLERRAIAVVDLGFGDAGKGLTTDYLVRRIGATAVVRLSGGAQAGHNVVTPDGRHHCFSQWGAGTFRPGVDTWLGPRFVLHPTALTIEAAHLEDRGIDAPLGRLHVHADSLVITPVEQALGRLRELARGSSPHGSCGVGVGEVMRSEQLGAPVVRASVLRDRAGLTRTLRTSFEHARVAWQGLGLEDSEDPEVRATARIFEEPRLLDRWVGEAWPLGMALDILDDAAFSERLGRERHLVFEGAQGLLLDQDFGFFPHVTYGRSTFADADSLGRKLGLDEPVTHLGVTRTYAVRHGPGPFPSEHLDGRRFFEEPHNVTGRWQGAVRYGWLDQVLLRYATKVLGPLDALMVTHLDRVEHDWAWVERHEVPEGARLLGSGEPLPVVAPGALDKRSALSAELLRVTPVLSPLRLDRAAPGVDFARRLASRLGVTTTLGSLGPRATDVVELSG